MGKRFSAHYGDSFSGLDILVLSIIKNYDGTSEYAIIPIINKKFKDLWRTSPQIIYLLLNRLNRNDFVSVEEVNDSKNRKKRIYKIRKNSKKKLKEILRDNIEPSIKPSAILSELLYKFGYQIGNM
ncbi:MAG: PadR family transcriptional regulator [Promethearchaeota archaeon]